MFGYFTSKQNNHAPSTLPGIRGGLTNQIEHEDKENEASSHTPNMKDSHISYAGKKK